MPKPRYTQVSLAATPYYHCTSRCVRRAFLCGTDAFSGRCYEHRRHWLEAKLLEFGGIFALNICAYAVMSNHYHVVLHVDPAQAKAWSSDEVIERWHRLFAGKLLSQRYLAGESLNSAERQALDDLILEWRTRLQDISWFMRVLNERIARQANAEDGCTGRFWEGRFKSDALLDEAALLASMAYTDLNPIRAKLAKTPETSAFTSIRRRIHKAQASAQPNHPRQQPKALWPFAGYASNERPAGLPFRLTDYLELVDWTGRCLRAGKRGQIEASTPPILQRLKFDTTHWLYLTRHFESPFKGLVGTVAKLKRACEVFGYTRTPGRSACSCYFP